MSSITNMGIILSWKRTTKVLIRMRECAVWSMPLLYPYDLKKFSHDLAYRRIVIIKFVCFDTFYLLWYFLSALILSALILFVCFVTQCDKYWCLFNRYWCSAHCGKHSEVQCAKLETKKFCQICIMNCHWSSSWTASDLHHELPFVCIMNCHWSASWTAIDLHHELPLICIMDCHLSASWTAICLHHELPLIFIMNCHWSASWTAICLHHKLPLIIMNCHWSSSWTAIDLHHELPLVCIMNCHWSASWTAIYTLLLSGFFIWAASWQNQQNDVCAQWRLRSAWASIQSDQRLCCALWVAKDPSFLHADSEDWSDWVDDQTGRMPRLIWVFTGSTGQFLAHLSRQAHKVSL